MAVGAFTQLQAIEQTSFGKNLLDTIALQVKNQAPLSDVAMLLGELKSDLLHQQAEDDELHSQREGECETAIAEYNTRIAFASNEITEATGRISQLHDRINELESSIDSYHRQISDTETSIQNAIDTRAQRAAQFESRTAQHTGVVEALDLILDRLSQGSAGTTDEAAFAQLAKIGKSNPIGAFVQLAASLPQESWDNLKSKIQALRDATAASLVDDEDQERLEISNHNDFLGEMYSLLENLNNGLNLDEQELAEQKADLADQEIRLSTNTQELQNATEGKDAKERQCQQWRDQYVADSAQRSSEVSIVEQVQDIFARKLDSAQGYLRDRMEGN